VSRTLTFQTCKQKALFHEEGHSGEKLSEPLTTGSAYHKGVAVLTSKKNLVEAIDASTKLYKEEMGKVMILPEERPLHEANITMVKRMLTAQAKLYEHDSWTVLMPEVEGLVAIPGTEHHCWYIHKILYPNIPEENCGIKDCFHPHYLKFRTDGILNWNGLIWIMERKTSGMKQDIFWDQWYLSHQLSAYVWGVKKTTGLPVHGVVLEKMPKPARNQNPATFDYTPEREPYLRDDSELANWLVEFTAIADDFEARAIALANGANRFFSFYRNPQSCCNYNRKCEYHSACKRGYVQPGEFRPRDQDYVEKAYYTLLNIPNPKEPKEVKVVNPTTD
jgi:hypothetical protein